jgi:hypothetical protein
MNIHTLRLTISPISRRSFYKIGSQALGAFSDFLFQTQKQSISHNLNLPIYEYYFTMSSTSTTNYLSPVTFNARGSNPDVRLEVFNTMFHVHSGTLKLNSHFFFTFFDSADKLQSPAFTDGFKYE